MMLRFVLRRLILLVFVLLGMSVITFMLSHMVPGDPARLLAGQRASEEQVQAVARMYGLDRSLPEQYAIYIGGLFRGDLGMSMTTRRPVLQDLVEYLPATLELTGFAMLLVIGLGIPLGMLAAVERGKILDHVTRVGTIAGVSLPIFWLGIALQIVFYKWIPVLPIGGRLGIIDIPPMHFTGAYTIDALLAGDFELFKSAALHLLLPGVTLAVGSIAVVTRMMRASVIETLDMDYIRTARAKGLRERVVLWRHVFKNAMIPTTTVIGLQIGVLLAGNVLIEVVFNWPGIGLYAVNAIRYLDYAAIMGVTLVISFIYVSVNMVVDLLYIVLNPRISYGSVQ